MLNKLYKKHGYISMNKPSNDGLLLCSSVKSESLKLSMHALYTQDAIEFLKKMPDNSVQLILIDPPYNLEMDIWDSFPDYLEWSKQWIDHIFRILKDTGNCVIFGGFQFQDLKHGDLLEVLHYARHNTKLRLINLIIWYYKNGISARRFFANRHEEAIWLSKTNKYYFDLDAVRLPYDEKAKASALKDKRLIPENVEKGKNPTNVWEIGRLNGNSTERVGHPTQKPLELIRRFVRSLSYEGSLVLDFFAGSGTTGRVCIEENRHSILVDTDSKMKEYFRKHISMMNKQPLNPYVVCDEIDIDRFLNEINND